MTTLYIQITTLCAQRGITYAKMCADTGISKGLLSDLKAERRSGISAETAYRIAKYFGVSVGYLLGHEPEPCCAVTDTDVKAALFGDAAAPDDVYQEVLRYAAYLKQRTKN